MRIRSKGDRRRAGFTLVELMIVIAVIAIVASIGIPQMVSARAASQESAAISTLRSISSAQAQLQSTSAIDTNGDGAGEYGGFGELSGAAPLRISVARAPAAGVVGVDELEPPALSPMFGDVGPTGAVAHKGYVYRIYLPGAGADPVGIGEAPGGGFTGAPFPDPTNGSVLWCAYAWPINVGGTGRRAFFVSEDGQLLASMNRGTNGAPVYTGNDAAGQPAFDAAYSGPSMTADLAIDQLGSDGNIWIRVQ